MSKYDLRFDGKTYSGISLAEVRALLSTKYTCGYVDMLVSNVKEMETRLRANKLCAEVETTIEQVREVCHKIDEEFKQWLLSAKSTSAVKRDSVAR